MQYDVIIMEYQQDVRGYKLATFDIKVKYSDEKWEIFRNLGLFQKNNKRWVNFPKFKRGEKWIDLYERTPSLDKNILFEAQKILENEYL